MEKEKITMEYQIKSSQKILFNRLSTAGGLNEWFADNVSVKGKTFTFNWGDSEQSAEMISKKDLKYVKYRWLEEEVENAYFEFRLQVDELTGDLALLITDFCEQDEKNDFIELWDTQVSELKRILGS